MTTREGETMNLNDPNSIRETVFAIARDGARPHIKAGIVSRLQNLANDMRRDETPNIRYIMALECEIKRLEELT